jgi:WD40 repeat protein
MAYLYRLNSLVAASVCASVCAGQTAVVEELVLKGHTNSVLALAYSPNGKILASAGVDKNVRLWNPTTGESTAVLMGHRFIVKSLAFTPDNKILLSGAGQSKDNSFVGELNVWDVSSGRLKRTIAMKPNNDVNAVACFPDGKRVATGGIEGISLWEIETGELKRSLPTDNSATLDLAVTPDGQTIVSGSFDTLLRLWDLRTWKVKQTFADHRSEIRATKLSADGKMLATYTGGRKEAYLWDLEGGRLQRTIKTGDDIESLAIAPAGRMLATAGHRPKTSVGRISIWDTRSGQHLGIVEDVDGPVLAMVFSSDGKTLATAGVGMAIKICDLRRL